MKLGLHVGYWGLGLEAADQLAMVREAEALGLDSVWTAEAYGSDAATVLAWLAAGTNKIKLGSGIFQMSARTPALTAMTAATLDHLSDGRFKLGLGVSGPQVVEGWHGQPFAKPLKRTREYVEIVRRALAREPLTYDGELYKLPLPGGAGKTLKLTIDTVQERVPIYLAANGPKNTALAAEIADGWIPTLFAPDRMEVFRPSLEEGASRSGRNLDDLDIAPMLQVAIGDDLEQCRHFMRPFIALYVGGMGSREKNFYKSIVSRYGFEAEAGEIQDLYLGGKKAEAMAAVPPELIDMTTLCGPKDRVRDRVAAYADAGAATLMVTPVAATQDERMQILRDLAEIAAE